MISEEKRKEKIKKLTVAFGLLFLFQVVMLIYVNLTQMQMHMGYDASGHYLTVIEMWRQKAWMLDNWQRNTSLLFDTSAPLAVWLMPVFRNVFMAYGAANLIIDGALIVAVWLLSKELGLATEARLFVLCVLFCPYLGINFNNYNDLMYFSMMYTNCAAYNVKLLLTVLFWLGFISLQNKNFGGGAEQRLHKIWHSLSSDSSRDVRIRRFFRILSWNHGNCALPVIWRNTYVSIQ